MERDFYFWCFKCKSGCLVYEDDNNDLHCEKCNSTFVEEIEEGNSQNQSGNPSNFIPRDTSTSSIPNTNRSNNFFIQITNNNGQISYNTNTNFNSGNLFTNVLNDIFGLGTAPLDNFLQRHNNDVQFENLLNYLMMNDPNRHGKPPASKKAVEELPRVKVTQENLEQYRKMECSICFENFVDNDIVTKITCGHSYHDNCLLDWLKLHNNCPICRYELVTDDPDYENRKNQNRNILRNYNNNS
jgi:E3 ubiquitin-protein ligase RNF115/126